MNYELGYLTDDAAALNSIIETADKPYIAFMYSKQRYDSKRCRQLARRLDLHPECSVACGCIKFQDNTKISLEGAYPDEAAILDVDADFSFMMVYPEGMMCRTDELRASGIRFDESLACCRDELFAMQVALYFKTRYYDPYISYRPDRIYDESSQKTPQADRIEWYLEAVDYLPAQLQDPQTGALSRAAQYGLLYLTIQRFHSNENKMAKMVFADETETQSYIDRVAALVRRFDTEVLLCRKPAVSWSRPRLVYLARLGGDETKTQMVVRDDGKHVKLYMGASGHRMILELFGQVMLEIQNIDLARDEDGNEGFRIYARFNTQFPPDSFELYLRNSWEGGHVDAKLERTPILASRMAFFDQVAYTVTLYEAYVPLSPKVKPQKITAFGKVAGREVELTLFIIGVETNHIAENDPRVAWSIPHYSVYSEESAIHIVPRTRAQKAVAELSYCKRLLLGNENQQMAGQVRMAYWLTKPYFKNKRIWAYYDKAFKAGDNGEFAFRYASSQKDGIDHVYYLSPKAKEYEDLAKDGRKVLDVNDRKGLVYALNAEVIFCTHIPAYRTMGIDYAVRKYYKDLMNANVVRMYHGFTLTHDPSYSQAHMNSMATVVGSTYEHDLYAEPVHGFADSQIIDSGMPRHDGIVHRNKRQLLFAPTWRPTLRKGQSEIGETLYNPDFRESRYYKTYAAIFNDERLLECARRCGYKIKLFLHPRMAPQTPDFEPNDVFEALDCTKDSDYVTMMCESDLMVTDFSSVMVDFAFARKPVVYYQDPALPYWRHHDFDYKGIGFGEVCESPDELIDTLCGYMENDCALKDFYRKRIDDFFFFDDRNNSKRLYEAVRKMTDGKKGGV